MTVTRSGSFLSLADAFKAYQDLIDNLSPEDLKAGNFRTSEPTTDTLDKAHFAFAEISGVPTIYYRGINGTIYKWTGTAV